MLILAAVLIVISKLGMISDVEVFFILAFAFLVWTFMKGSPYVKVFGRLFYLALICIVYAQPQGIEAPTPWAVLMVALFLGIGFSMLFQGKRKRNHHIETDWSRRFGNLEIHYV